MTTPAPTSTSPTARLLWRRARGLLLAAAVLAVAGVTIAALRSGEHTGALDPRSTAPYGSKALSRLLADRGVRTDIVTSTDQVRAETGPRTTLLVPFPNSLDDHQRKAVRDAADHSGRTVLLSPGPDATAALIHGVRTSAPTPVQRTPPDCTLPAAQRADDSDLGGFRYTTNTEGSDACYLSDGKPTLLRVPHALSEDTETSGDTVLLGTPEPLYNKHLDQHGNASLTLQLLGTHPRLLWYLPTDAGTAPPSDQQRGLLDLIPSGWTWATLQLGVAAALAALWRARRLGPLVPEKLPVSVPASETTEGRARLYRRANARGHAADALRSASRTRLAPQAGLPPAQAHLPEVLVPALTDRTARHPVPAPDSGPFDERTIRTLLFGPPPQDDAALVRLADDLDRLERHLISDTSPATPPKDKDTSS
ncbi:hypothetical protein ADL27_50970 [Streptomyces sp. NRRL F-6602]|nr:hypothetical protein ADL27_50970 [Streptomyces sp. NRRL F-6602]